MLWSPFRSSRSRGFVRARTLPAAVVVVFMLGLVSCSDAGKDEPTTAPMPTSSSSDGGGDASDGGGETSAASSPSAEGGEGGSALPTASDGGGERVTMTKDDFPPPDPANYPGLNTHTEQGAIATATYFWDSLFWASWSGETAIPTRLSSEECVGCQLLLERSNDAYMNQLYLTPSYVIPRAETVEARENYQGYDIVIFMTIDERVTAKNLKGREDHFRTAHGMNWNGKAWKIHLIESELLGRADA